MRMEKSNYRVLVADDEYWSRENLRNLIDMSRNRLCTRAYWEYRELLNDILSALSKYSEEWAYIVDTQMKPKCEILGYCPERHSCGRKEKRSEKD